MSEKKRLSIADLEKAADEGKTVHIAPNGDATIIGGLVSRDEVVEALRYITPPLSDVERAREILLALVTVDEVLALQRQYDDEGGNGTAGEMAEYFRKTAP